MIFIIDDDKLMAECIARACEPSKARIFANAIDVAEAVNNELTDLIFLDILLDVPDGFTLLNELASYTDTAQIPVVIVSSLDFKGQDLTNYGVVGVLDKNKMTPQEIKGYAKQYA